VRCPQTSRQGETCCDSSSSTLPSVNSTPTGTTPQRGWSAVCAKSRTVK
jgi:hypothetical protein